MREVFGRFAAVLLVMALAGQSQAQFNWVSPNTGLTTDPTNWTPGVPPDSIDSIWNFGGTGGDSYGVLNNFPTGYQLNAINWTSSSLGAILFLPNATTPTSLTFSLSSTAVAPSMNMSGAAPIFFTTPIAIAATAPVFNFGGNGTGRIYFNGTISGAAKTINKTGNWRLTLSQANNATLTGATVWNLNGGTVDIQNSINQLGPATTTVNFNGGTLAVTTAGVNSSASRFFNFQTGNNAIEVQIPTTTYGTSTAAAANFIGSSNASFNKIGPGTMQLGFNYSLFNSNVTVSEGTLLASADGAFGTGSAINVLSGATVSLSAANFTAANNRTINAAGFGFPDVTAMTINGLGSGAITTPSAAGSVAYSNPINLNGITSIGASSIPTLTLSAPVGEITPASSLIKDNSSTLILTVANSYTGPTTIRYGQLRLSGANGSLLTTSAINVGNLVTAGSGLSGVLVLDNTVANNNNRIGDSTPINFTSGQLSVTGNSAATTAETIGPVTLNSGSTFFSLTPNAAQNTQITLASLTRNNNSTALFSGGNTLGATPGPGNGNIFVTTPFAPGDFVGNAALPLGQPILRWGVNGNGGTAIDFLTYDPTVGLKPLGASGYFVTSGIDPTANNLNVRLSGNATSVDSVINALDLAGNSINMSANSFVRIASGAIINQAGFNAINSNFNAAVMDFGSQEAILMGPGISVNAYMIANGGLTQGANSAGGIPTTLNQPNVINGSITMNGASAGNVGQLLVNNLSALGSSSNPWVFAGGQLNIQGALSSTIPNNITVREGGGNIALGAGTTDPGPVFTHTGSITGPGRFQKSGAGTLVLTSDNATAGFTGQTMITGGVLSISNANNLGTGELLMNGGRLLVTGNSTFGPTRNIGMAAPSAFSVDTGATLSLQGVLVGSSAITKNGPGTLAFEGANLASSTLTIVGSPTVREPTAGGAVVFSGANGRWFGSTLQVNSATTLTFDNTVANNNNRIRDDVAPLMAGGTLRWIGNANVPTQEVMGALAIGTASNSLDATLSRISLEPAPGQQLLITTNGLTRASTRSALILTGPIPTGPNMSGWLGPNIANLIPNASPVLAGTVGGTGSQVPILPGAMGDTTTGGNGTGFLTYNSASGMRLLGGSEYIAAISNNNSTLTNVRTNSDIAGLDGTTTINSLILSGGNTVSGGGTLTLNSGTIASLGAAPNTIANLTIATPVSTALHFFTNQDLMITGSVAGSSGSGVVKSGPGTLTLANTNSFSGGLSINGGAVSVASDAALGAAAGVVNLDGGTLRITSTIASTRTVNVLAGGGTIDIGANDVSWGATGVPSFGGTGTVGTSGYGAVTKTGVGTLTFGSMGTTSFAGGLTVQQGAVVFNASVSNISDQAPLTINGGAALTFNGASSDTVGSVAGAGGLNLGVVGSPFALTIGTFNPSLGSSTPLTPDATFTGNITGPATSSIVKAGLGDWTVNAGPIASNYAGTWSVMGGRLIVGGDALLNTDGVLGNSSSAISVGQTSASSDGAALLTNGSFTIARPINIVTSGGTAMAQISAIGTLATSGTSVFSGNITVGTVSNSVAKLMQVHAAGSSTVDLQGQIAIGGGYTGVLTIEKTGTGTVQFSNPTNTYSGRTVLTSGTLALGASGTAAQGPIGTSTLVINGGTIAAAGANRSIENPVILNNDVTFGGSFNVAFGTTNPFFLGLGDRTITVNNPRVTINGEVRGSQGFTGFGGIIKRGPGQLELTGANSYSGTTTTEVDGGTLLVDNVGGSGTGGSMVRVNNMGTLGGVGKIGGNITINGGGTVSPGISPGTLTAQAGITFNTGSHLFLEFRGTSVGQYDQLAVTAGNVDLGNAMVALDISGFAPNANDVFVVMPLSPGVMLTGTFNGQPDGSIVASNVLGTGIDYRIYYGTNANFPGSVVISPTPEPATVLAICAAAAGAGGWMRRRRQIAQNSRNGKLSSRSFSRGRLPIR